MSITFDHDPMTPFLETDKRPFPEREDAVLTHILRSAFDELFSLSEIAPPCPHCDSKETMLFRRASPPRPHVPSFECKSCGSYYRRATGTPMTGVKMQNIDLELFIRLLSRHQSIRHAAQLLEVKAVTVTNWVKRVRDWLLLLDPTGEMEARVRLGTIAYPDLRCPDCGTRDSLRYRGFSQDTADRVCQCVDCGKYRRLAVIARKVGGDFVLAHKIVNR